MCSIYIWTGRWM